MNDIAMTFGMSVVTAHKIVHDDLGYSRSAVSGCLAYSKP